MKKKKILPSSFLNLYGAVKVVLQQTVLQQQNTYISNWCVNFNFVKILNTENIFVYLAHPPTAMLTHTDTHLQTHLLTIQAATAE